MNSALTASTARALRTPRAAAVAGIVFSVLFATSVVLLQWALPAASSDPGAWVDDPARRKAVSLSLQLLPFAGIAFLWFIGVLRDRIGEGEDRFFATVFLGSGLLFVAMFFASGAIAAGLVTTAAESTSAARLGSLWPFGRRSTATLAMRLRLVPRWLALLGYATAAVLLFGVGLVPWLELLFPAWVLVLSTYILITTFRPAGASRQATDDGPYRRAESSGGR